MWPVTEVRGEVLGGELAAVAEALERFGDADIV